MRSIGPHADRKERCLGSGMVLVIEREACMCIISVASRAARGGEGGGGEGERGSERARMHAWVRPVRDWCPVRRTGHWTQVCASGARPGDFCWTPATWAFGVLHFSEGRVGVGCLLGWVTSCPSGSGVGVCVCVYSCFAIFSMLGGCRLRPRHDGPCAFVLRGFTVANPHLYERYPPVFSTAPRLPL